MPRYFTGVVAEGLSGELRYYDVQSGEYGREAGSEYGREYGRVGVRQVGLAHPLPGRATQKLAQSRAAGYGCGWAGSARP